MCFLKSILSLKSCLSKIITPKRGHIGCQNRTEWNEDWLVSIHRSYVQYVAWFKWTTRFWGEEEEEEEEDVFISIQFEEIFFWSSEDDCSTVLIYIFQLFLNKNMCHIVRMIGQILRGPLISFLQSFGSNVHFFYGRGFLPIQPVKTTVQVVAILACYIKMKYEIFFDDHPFGTCESSHESNAQGPGWLSQLGSWIT